MAYTIIQNKNGRVSDHLHLGCLRVEGKGAPRSHGAVDRHRVRRQEVYNIRQNQLRESGYFHQSRTGRQGLLSEYSKQ